jgi:hypothetical protein
MANKPQQTAAEASGQEGQQAEYVKPSDALAAAFIADPRYTELIGEMFRECSSWLAETPEVGYGQFKGISRMVAWLEQKGKHATVEILKPPVRMPVGFTFDGTLRDEDGMDD